jgi:hypothetical protein
VQFEGLCPFRFVRFLAPGSLLRGERMHVGFHHDPGLDPVGPTATAEPVHPAHKPQLYGQPYMRLDLSKIDRVSHLSTRHCRPSNVTLVPRQG